MKKLKPFKGRVRRFAEGDEVDTPDETGTYRSGVKLGKNVNISDETRQRAMDRMEAKRTLDELAKERPAPATRAAVATTTPTPRTAKVDTGTDTGDETARLARRAPVDPGYRKGTLEDPDYRKKLEKEQALESVHPEEYLVGGGTLKALQKGAAALASRGAAREATAVATRGAREPGLNTIIESTANRLPAPAASKALPAPAEKAGARLTESPPRPSLPAPDRASQQAADIMKSARDRAAAMRESMAAKAKKAAEFKTRMIAANERRASAQAADIVAKGKERARAAREARFEKSPARDVEEARMGGEGGGFRKGGSVRGCGIARKGLTRGTMR